MTIVVGRRYVATRSMTTKGAGEIRYEGVAFVQENVLYLGSKGLWRTPFSYLFNNDYEVVPSD